jgi:hypothetical protein
MVNVTSIGGFVVALHSRFAHHRLAVHPELPSGGYFYVAG